MLELQTKADTRLLATPMDGTDPRNIESLLRRAGHQLVVGEMSVEDLKYFTRGLRPVICVVKGHYVVVGGVSKLKVQYQDPLHGPLQCKIGDFVGWWSEDDRLGVKYKQFGIAVSR